MNTLGNRDRDLDDYNYDRHNQTEDREISLGTGTILGIFFALAVVCAVFFGFGYAMGRKSAAATPAARRGGERLLAGRLQPREAALRQPLPEQRPNAAGSDCTGTGHR